MAWLGMVWGLSRSSQKWWVLQIFSTTCFFSCFSLFFSAYLAAPPAAFWLLLLEDEADLVIFLWVQTSGKNKMDPLKTVFRRGTSGLFILGLDARGYFRIKWGLGRIGTCSGRNVQWRVCWISEHFCEEIPAQNWERIAKTGMQNINREMVPSYCCRTAHQFHSVFLGCFGNISTVGIHCELRTSALGRQMSPVNLASHHKTVDLTERVRVAASFFFFSQPRNWR